jgi:NitT/TauT family transport system ATP-binding protein
VLAGLLEILESRGGRDDLPELGRLLTFEVDDLLPIVDAVEMLGFAVVADADIELTAAGKALAGADIRTSKELFAAAAATRAPLVRAVVRALETTKDHTLGERFFLDLLQRGFSEDEARAQLDIAINWGRYAELFDYHADAGELILTPPDDHVAA